MTDYVSLLGTYYGVTTVNHGQQGDTSCDLAQKVFTGENPTTPVAGLYTAMIGTNDANNEGAGAYEAVYHNCHLAALSWLAVVRSSKVFAQDVGCVQSGTWTVDNTYQSGIGESSSTSGSTLSCSITTQGNPIYIWHRLINTNTGTFTYSLDGGTAVSTNAFTTPAMANNVGTVSVGMIRVPGVSAGSHSVKITVTSSTGSVPILAIGSAPTTGYVGQPVVYSAGVPFQQNDNHLPPPQPTTLTLSLTSTRSTEMAARSTSSTSAPPGASAVLVDLLATWRTVYTQTTWACLRSPTASNP